MSRIGNKPVAIPAGVTVDVKEDTVVVKGSKGELSLTVLPEVAVALKDGMVIVTRRDDSAEARARHGLTRALLANMVTGVSKGYEKRLEVIGVGFKAQARSTGSGQAAGKSGVVTLQLGFSHPIEYAAPSGVDIQNDAENKQLLIIRGCDKKLVGQVAADIRSFRPPEPYKGKGIRYVDEYVRRKVGKAAVKTTAA